MVRKLPLGRADTVEPRSGEVLRRNASTLVTAGAALMALDVARLFLLPAGLQTVFLNGFEAFIAAVCAVACARAASRSATFGKGQWSLVAAYFVILSLADLHDFLAAALVASSSPLLGPLQLLGWFTYVPLAFLLVFPVEEEKRRSPWTWLSTLDFAQVALVLGVAYFHYVYLAHATAQAPWTTRLRVDDLRNAILTIGLLLRAYVDPTARARAFYRRVGGAFGTLTFFQALFTGGALDLVQTLVRPAALLALGICAALWDEPRAERAAPPRHRGAVSRWLFGVLPAAGPLLVLAMAEGVPERFKTAMTLAFAASVVLFLLRAGVAEHERQASARLSSALAEIAREASVADDLDALFAAMHRIVGSLLNARNFFVALHDPASGTVSYPYFVDERDVAPRPRPTGRGLTEYVLKTGEALLASRAMRLELLARGEVEPHGTPSTDWLGAPLKTAGGVFGVMAVQSYSDLVRFGEREKGILAFVAQHVSSVIDRKRTEDSLRASERRYRTLLESAADAIVSVDAGGSITSVNARAESLFGYSRDELLGRPVDLLVPQRSRAKHEAERAAYTKAPVTRPMGRPAELVGLRKDGTEFPAEISLTPLAAEGTLAVTAIIRDVSEPRRMEAQLRQAQKMEAVGQLAGGVAHDFNNLLTVISGHGDLLLAGFPAEGAARESALEIQRSAARAGALTRQLLAFSRKQMLALAPVDLNRLVADAERTIRQLVAPDIQVTTMLASLPRPVIGDHAQLERVLVNLALNARDAMQQGGTLAIGTQTARVTSRDPERSPGLPPGEWALLTVADTGAGMSPDVRSRIFEPFFTTKGTGKGTGLGLAVVYGVVKQCRGFVYADSEPGKGTTFRIYLSPAAPGVRPPAPPSTPMHETVAGGETVLLVEDDRGILELAQRALRGAGYKVLPASTGPEALELAERHPEPIDLLLTDVAMPEMNGLELAERVAAIRPGVKVLLVSGSREYVPEAGDTELPFVQKPFSALELLRRVWAVLHPSA